MELRTPAALSALGHPRNSISAELEFVFPPVGTPGISNLRYPKLKLSTNEAQPIALCLSPKTHPTRPKTPGFLGSELRAFTINAFNQVRTSSKLDFHKTCDVHLGTMGYPEGNQAQQPRYFPGSPAAHVLSLNFETMKLQTAPEEFGTQAVARLLSSLFHSE